MMDAARGHSEPHREPTSDPPPVLEYQRPIPKRRPWQPWCFRVAGGAVYLAVIVLLTGGAIAMVASLFQGSDGKGVMGMGLALLFYGALFWVLEDKVMQNRSRLCAAFVGAGLLVPAAAIAMSTAEDLVRGRFEAVLAWLASAFIVFCSSAHLVWAVQSRRSRRRHRV
jgi:peptidoglycan/LPS O-acetylase OafA/YrhL